MVLILLNCSSFRMFFWETISKIRFYQLISWAFTFCLSLRTFLHSFLRIEYGIRFWIWVRETNSDEETNWSIRRTTEEMSIGRCFCRTSLPMRNSIIEEYSRMLWALFEIASNEGSLEVKTLKTTVRVSTVDGTTEAPLEQQLRLASKVVDFQKAIWVLKEAAKAIGKRSQSGPSVGWTDLAKNFFKTWSDWASRGPVSKATRSVGTNVASIKRLLLYWLKAVLDTWQMSGMLSWVTNLWLMWSSFRRASKFPANTRRAKRLSIALFADSLASDFCFVKVSSSLMCCLISERRVRFV